MRFFPSLRSFLWLLMALNDFDFDFLWPDDRGPAEALQRGPAIADTTKVPLTSGQRGAEMADNNIGCVAVV